MVPATAVCHQYWTFSWYIKNSQHMLFGAKWVQSRTLIFHRTLAAGNVVGNDAEGAWDWAEDADDSQPMEPAETVIERAEAQQQRRLLSGGASELDTCSASNKSGRYALTFEICVCSVGVLRKMVLAQSTFGSGPAVTDFVTKIQNQLLDSALPIANPSDLAAVQNVRLSGPSTATGCTSGLQALLKNTGCPAGQHRCDDGECVKSRRSRVYADAFYDSSESGAAAASISAAKTAHVRCDGITHCADAGTEVKD
jgi:hypothetical protein